MSGRIVVVILAVLSALMVGCSYRDQGGGDDTAKYITILHTNDHHGRFWHSKRDEYGMAARKSLIDGIRKEVEMMGGSTLLLSAGDINTGVPESDLLDAKPDFEGMNEMGYDGMAVGNHEFDNSPEVLAEQRKWAEFPLLSANVYIKSTGERLFDPYKILRGSGLTIAIIGLTTGDTAKVGNPKYIKHLEFRDPIEEAKRLIPKIREKEQPDVMIALTHMGYYENGEHGVNAPGDVTLARSLENGAVDIVVGGHTHDAVCMRSGGIMDTEFGPGDECEPDVQNGVVIVQAKEWGKYLGRADYKVEDGTAKLIAYRLIPVNLVRKSEGKNKKALFPDPPISRDKKLESILADYQEQGGDELHRQVGIVLGTFEGEREVIRFRQTNLGRLIAAAQQQRAKADCGVVNSGGIRGSFEKGAVTYKDILMVQPYGNTLTYTDMNGRELTEYLEKVASKPVDTGGYAQFSGITLSVENARITDLYIDGIPVDPARTYRIAVPSYNAEGGDGYPRLVEHPAFVDTGFVDAEILMEYLEKNSPLNPDDYAVSIR